MKKIVRNALWSMIISWCLLLNGYVCLDMLVAVFSCLYLKLKLKRINHIRVLLVFTVFNILSFATSLFSDVVYQLPFPFLLLINMAYTLAYEASLKLDLTSLSPLVMIILVSEAVFYGFALLIPSIKVIAYIRENSLALCFLIFSPFSFLELFLVSVRLSKRKNHVLQFIEDR